MSYFFIVLIWILVLNTVRLFLRELRNRRIEVTEWRAPNMLPNDFVLRESIADMLSTFLVMLLTACGLTIFLQNINWIDTWYSYLIVAILAVVFITSWFMSTDRITWKVVVKDNFMEINFLNLDFESLRESIHVEDISVEKRSNGNIVLFVDEWRLFTVWRQNAAYGLMVELLLSDEEIALLPDFTEEEITARQQRVERKCTACGAPTYGKRCEYCGVRVRKSRSS